MSLAAVSDHSLPSIAVIIVNYRAGALVAANLDALLDELRAFAGAQVVIVDNASPGDDAAVMKAAAEGHPEVKVVEAERNGGFAYGNNRGLAEAELSDLVFFLNPDARPRPGSLARLAKTLLEDPANGVVGPLLVNSEGTIRASAFARSTVTREFFASSGLNGRRLGIDSDRVIDVTPDAITEGTWIPGAAMMVRRGVIDRVGGMDEGYFLYFEEVDWLETVGRAGYRILCDSRAVVEHIEGQSTGIVSGQMKSADMPAYWYDSWRRYWTKNRSRRVAAAAALAFCAGLVMRSARQVARGRNDDARGPRLGSFVRRCVLPIIRGQKV